MVVEELASVLLRQTPDLVTATLGYGTKSLSSAVDIAYFSSDSLGLDDRLVHRLGQIGYLSLQKLGHRIIDLISMAIGQQLSMFVHFHQC